MKPDIAIAEQHTASKSRKLRYSSMFTGFDKISCPTCSPRAIEEKNEHRLALIKAKLTKSITAALKDERSQVGRREVHCLCHQP
jgi:hypothetical protein